jgi:hypothetical protein
MRVFFSAGRMEIVLIEMQMAITYNAITQKCLSGGSADLEIPPDW